MPATPDNSNPADSRTEDSVSRQIGTQSAFFHTFSPRLEALIRHRLSPRFQARFDAADIVQSAFRSFFFAVNPQQFSASDDDKLWPLLVEIAVRKLSQQVRRHSAQRRSVNADTPMTDPMGTLADPLAATSVSETIELMLRDLDTDAGQAFLMRLEGFEITEIADRLDLSERTVRRYLDSAKQKLTRLLTDTTTSVVRATPARTIHDRQATDSRPQIASSARDLQLTDYLLQKWVGDGAVGNVYRALQKSTGRIVAVKFIKKAFRFHAPAIESFEREIELVEQFDHPGILHLIGLGKTPRQGDFLVMDWAAGGDLSNLAAENRPSQSTIRKWILELANALEYAYQHGVIHCDLKPSNVLIASAGQLLLCDFGLARRWRGWSQNNVTGGGTPAYIAPELIEPTFGEVGPWTDVFGLGAILFHLLTDRHVHQGATLDTLLADIVNPTPVAWPAETRIAISPEWRRCCESMLAKSVSARLPDMAAVRQAMSDAV